MDKQAHLGASAAIVVAGAALLSLLLSPVAAIAVAVVAGAAVGVGKEMLDSRRGGTGFSVGDLLADVAGICLGVALAALLFAI